MESFSFEYPELGESAKKTRSIPEQKEAYLTSINIVYASISNDGCSCVHCNRPERIESENLERFCKWKPIHIRGAYTNARSFLS